MLRIVLTMLQTVFVFMLLSCASLSSFNKANVNEYEKDRAVKKVIKSKTVKIVTRCFPNTIAGLLQTGSGFTASGTGVILKSFEKKSYILTAHHVITHSDFSCFSEVFKSSDRFMMEPSFAHNEIKDKKNDLALVSVAVNFGINSTVASEAYVGQKLTVAGYPGIDLKSSSQSISINSGEYATEIYEKGGCLYVFRMTSDVWSGYSGGAVFNVKGQIVGITSFMIAVPVAIDKRIFLVPRPGFYFARPYNKIVDMIKAGGLADKLL